MSSNDAPGGQGNPDLLEMQRQLVASAGFRANALMAMVNRVSYILQGNIRQYNSLIDAMQQPQFAIPILDAGNPQNHDAMLSEAERLLHNVVLALKTRVDLLRVFMEKYFADDSNLTSAYIEEVGKSFDADSVKFLESLRNHMTHHLLPVSRSRQTYRFQGPMTFTLTLSTQALLEWDWSARVRQWIEQQSPDVMIVEVVNDYGQRARRFDEWLIGKISKKYHQELSEFETAAEAFNRQVDRIFGV